MILTKAIPHKERFWLRTRLPDNLDECWEFQGSVGNSGYGRLKVNGIATTAHRYSWQLYYGDIPNGMLVLHHCDNKVCVNPKHLFIGTHSDNVQDMIRKGRGNYPRGAGEQASNVKLTQVEVDLIRSLYASGRYSYRNLGDIYGVTLNNIYHIVKRHTWK